MTNPYVILLLVTAFVNLVLAIYALRFIKSPGTLIYSILLTSISLYTLGYAFEVNSSDLQHVIFWLNIEYIGISFLPPLFFFLAVQYTGKSDLLKPWLVVLLILISLITLLLQMTNFCNLYYLEMKLNYGAPFPVADFIKGPWYWIHQAYTNLMLLISCILYYIKVRKSFDADRTRTFIMLFSHILPWGFYLIYLAGGSPFHIDLSPFSFSIVGFLAALGMFRYNLFEFVPIAFQHVFDSMTDAVIILDTHRHIARFNPSALSIIPDLSAFPKDKPADEIFASWIDLANLSIDFESDIQVGNQGEPRYYHLRVAAIYSDKKRLAGWIIIFTNITERKLKENNLLDIEKKLKELNSNKDKFLAIIAHDLRNSFHLIINFSDMILNNIEKDDKPAALKKGKVIYNTSVSTYSLLQNLLEWALVQQQGKSFNPEILSLNLLVDGELSNLRPLAEQKSLTITRNFDRHMEVNADEEMIKTVFRNLLTNAIKYSYVGGQIRITASAADKLVTIAVSDDGIGMTGEEQSRLFKIDSFFSKKGTAHENGTGLGLKLCIEFVRMHGGDIWVNSTAGKGSTFFFTVPAQLQ